MQLHLFMHRRADWSLVFSNNHGLGTFCPKNGQLTHLAVGDFRQIAYSPRNGGEITALHEGRLATFVNTKSGDAKLRPHNVFDLKDPLHRCLGYIRGKNFGFGFLLNVYHAINEPAFIMS